MRSEYCDYNMACKDYVWEKTAECGVLNDHNLSKSEHIFCDHRVAFRNNNVDPGKILSNKVNTREKSYSLSVNRDNQT